MTLPDWQSMQFYQWLAIGGGILLALSFALYFGAPNQGVRVPAGILIGVGGLGAGVGLGVILMGSLGYHWQQQDTASQAPPGGAGAGPGGGMMMMGGPPPDPKAQLSALVTKLDLLTGKPPALPMDKDLRQKVLEQVKDLDEKKDLPPEEAKKRFDALLALLKDQRETLTSVGYRWPQQRGGGGGPGAGSRGGPGGGPRPPGGPGGGPGGGRRPSPPNPFREGNGKEHLDHLRTQLGKTE